MDWLVPEWPAPGRVKALITTRTGGVSRGRYASFNLGERVGDDPECVSQNRAALRMDLPDEPKWLSQVHGIRVVAAESCVGRVQADASFTRHANTVCAILTADCLPVLLCDAAGSMVAAIHCGWRGLAAGVIEASVAAMRLAPESLMAFLGPAIGPQCYEVGDEVRAAFVQNDAVAASAFQGTTQGKWLANLYLLARQRLNASGVVRVYGGGYCTATERERFFSYRRDGVTGRMASLIWLTA